MNIQHRAREAVDVLRCHGPAPCLETFGHLHDRLDELIHLGEPIVVLDLSDVGEIDLGLVAELLACRQAVRDAGGVLNLVLSPADRHAFCEAGLDRQFEMYDDEDEAIESFAPETMTYGIP
jgi:anti-anti-sigma regulatory factor